MCTFLFSRRSRWSVVGGVAGRGWGRGGAGVYSGGVGGGILIFCLPPTPGGGRGGGTELVLAPGMDRVLRYSVYLSVAGLCCVFLVYLWFRF